MNKITTRVHIRWMVLKDTQEVLAIEDYLTESRLISLLRTRNNIGMVATIGGQIVGLMIYALHKEKIKLFYLSVHKDYRNQGVGQQMIDKMKSKLNTERRTKIEMFVSDFNLRGQLFLKRMGFLCTDIVKGFDDEEDNYIFEHFLNDEEEPLAF